MPSYVRPISRAQFFLTNNLFNVQCNINPPTIHILSVVSLTTLHVVPSASLSTFQRIVNKASPVPHADVNSRSQPSPSNVTQETPVSSLSHRLLAFASSSSSFVQPGSPVPTTTAQPHRNSPRPTSANLGGLTQADIGNAVLEVGGSVLSGMKTLSGMAYSAAKSRISPGDSSSPSPSRESDFALPTGGISNLFFSRVHLPPAAVVTVLGARPLYRSSLKMPPTHPKLLVAR